MRMVNGEVRMGRAQMAPIRTGIWFFTKVEGMGSRLRGNDGFRCPSGCGHAGIML